MSVLTISANQEPTAPMIVLHTAVRKIPLPISMFTVMEPPLHPQPHPARTSFPNENHELNQHISQQIEGSTVHSKQAHTWSLIVCITAPNLLVVPSFRPLLSGLRATK